MKLMIINGPNLNFTGIREKEVYGTKSYKQIVDYLKEYGKKCHIKLDVFQSNSEGKIIDLIQKAYLKKYDGIIINPGAYTHYSYAIRYAIKSVDINTCEVHLSNIYEREEFRKVSVISDVCLKTFFGKKEQSYIDAIDYLLALSIS